jgi:hypothetical protein
MPLILNVSVTSLRAPGRAASISSRKTSSAFATRHGTSGALHARASSGPACRSPPRSAPGPPPGAARTTRMRVCKVGSRKSPSGSPGVSVASTRPVKSNLKNTGGEAIADRGKLPAERHGHLGVAEQRRGGAARRFHAGDTALADAREMGRVGPARDRGPRAGRGDGRPAAG